MIKSGVINAQLASLLARFRHVNSIAIVDGPFPTYSDVETVDLAVTRGFPTIPQILDQILPLVEVSGLYLANEFKSKVEPEIVAVYRSHHGGISPTLIAHEEFKRRVGQTLGIIHTGDPIPYSSVILTSG